MPLDESTPQTIGPQLSDTVRERIQRNWDTLAPSVQERLRKAGLAPTPEEPAGTREDLFNTLKQGGKVALDYGPEMGLSAAGEFVGGRVAGPWGAAGGAGLGGTVGRGITTLATEGRLPTAGEAAATFGVNAAAPPVARGARWLMGKAVGPGTDEAMQLLQDARATDVPISAGEVSPGAAAAQAGIARLPTGLGSLETLNTRQNAALAAMIERDVLGPIGGRVGRTAAGRTVQEESLPALRAVKRHAHGLYDRASAEATAAGVTVNVPNAVTDSAENALRDLDAAGIPAAQSGRLRAVLQTVAQRAAPQVDAAGNVIGPPVPMPYREAEALVRDLRDVAPTYAQRGLTTSFQTGAIERVQGLLDAAMTDAVTGTPAEQTLTTAREFYRTEFVPLRQAVSAVRSRNVTPDQIVDLLVRARRPDRLEVVLQRLGPAGEEVRAAWFTSTLEQSVDRETGQFSPGQFLTRWKGLGPDTQALLSGGNPDAVNRSIRLLQAASRRQRLTDNPSKTAVGLGALAQGSALYGAMAGGPEGLQIGGQALAALAAPPVLGRILASPVAAHYFAQGLAAGPDSTTARHFFDQAMHALGVVSTDVGARLAGMELRDRQVERGTPP